MNTTNKSQFRIIPSEELPQGSDTGTEFTSLCISTVLYLSYLVGQCRKLGVVLERKIVTHISEAKTAHHSGNEGDVVINCMGLMASRLGGVMDKTLVPAGGQTVVRG